MLKHTKLDLQSAMVDGLQRNLTRLQKADGCEGTCFPTQLTIAPDDGVLNTYLVEFFFFLILESLFSSESLLCLTTEILEMLKLIPYQQKNTYFGSWQGGIVTDIKS